MPPLETACASATEIYGVRKTKMRAEIATLITNPLQNRMREVRSEGAYGSASYPLP
jgi:hypothetical protein